MFQNESVQNLSYENEFDLHEHDPVGGKNVHMNGFAQRLVWTQRKNKQLSNSDIAYSMNLAFG